MARELHPWRLLVVVKGRGSDGGVSGPYNYLIGLFGRMKLEEGAKERGSSQAVLCSPRVSALPVGRFGA